MGLFMARAFRFGGPSGEAFRAAFRNTVKTL
jgi:hypothetical protein